MLAKKFLRDVLLLTICIGGLFIFGCKKDEHPKEHPQEHPSSSNKAALTQDELADAIEAYINKASAATGGYFVAFDDKTGQELRLTLEKVHRARLSKVGEELYFACADFKTPQGKIYDLDVFMKGQDKENLTFSEFSIHKEAGQERYTWYEEGGIWKKKSLGTGAEHPAEHPKEHPK